MANYKKSSGVVLADSLRKAVLQWAIQGRLVPQVAEDGSAVDLLADIRAEKERLIGEKVIKKEKPLAPITDDEKPFDIPDSWVWVRLGDYSSFINGDRSSNYPVESDLVQDGIPFFGAKDMIGDELSYENNLRFISQEKFKKLSRGKLEDNDFVCLLRGSIGKTAIFKVKNNYQTGFINAQMVIIRSFNKNPISLIYIRNILNSEYFKSFIIQVSSGTAVKQLPAEILRNFLIPLPPLSEQERIVAKLDEILPQLDELAQDEKALHVLQSAFPKQMQSALLQSAISGKLTEQLESDGNASDLLTQIQTEKQRLISEKVIKKEKSLAPISDDEKPFDIPDNWVWVRLGDLTFNYGQKVPNKEFTYIDISSINNQQYQLGDDLKIIQPKDAPSRARKIVKKGQIIYSTVRPYLLNICILENDIEPEPIVSTGFAVLDTSSDITNKFLFKILLSPYFNSYANHTDNAKGVAYPAINDERLKNAVIPLPPLAEQERIVAKLDRLLPELQQLT